MKYSQLVSIRLEIILVRNLLIRIRSCYPFFRAQYLQFSSMQMSAVGVRDRSSNQMKMMDEAGRQRGRNFIERGQIGVIMMFSMVRSMRGPLRERLLQQEPIGVEMRRPSPRNSPILIFSSSQLFCRKMLRIKMLWFIPRWIYTWQVASPIFLQSTPRESFMRLSQGRFYQFSQSKTSSVRSSAQVREKLQMSGEVKSSVFPSPRMGGV